jgi:outer membrane protein assembly factor BamB
MESKSKRTRPERASPYLLPTVAQWDPTRKLKLSRADNPLPKGTLGSLGLAVRIDGGNEFPASVLVQPLNWQALTGIDAISIRFFRWDARAGTLKPVWNSGVNVSHGFAWAKISTPGTYVPLGLPRDRLLQQLLRKLARQRRIIEAVSADGHQALTEESLRVLFEVPEEALEELRELIMRAEVQTGFGLSHLSPHEVKQGVGGHLLAFPFPQGVSIADFRKRLRELRTPPGGLPEENLFYPPDFPQGGEFPWPTPSERMVPNGIDWRSFDKLPIWKYVDLTVIAPWLFSKDWWMYQHDIRHTGVASGYSAIQSTNAHTLVPLTPVAVDEVIYTKPAIVDGKIYIGTGRTGGAAGGTLYKINLFSGAIEGRYPTLGDGNAFYSYQGIGGSPAVTGGKVYFTGVHGKVYCINAATMTSSPPHPAPLWVTDLKHADYSKNQPANNPGADCWSGPLVVNGKVYVGCGEGEQADTYGFVYCLDATTGRVEWLFCTSKFSPAVHNSPNALPASIAASWAGSRGFAVLPDPPETGSSVWSSCAYDRVLNRIYVGTGNSEYNATGGSTDLPDELYGSGLLSLNADTGAFQGFFQPGSDDSYRPADADVDVPGSPTIFTRGGQRVVGFGSKNGSYFLLDANTMQVLGSGAQRRQLLPRRNGTGLPGNRGTAIPSVAPISGPWFENEWGIYATAAIHTGLGKIYVGLGGRGAISDLDKTPFVRALDWNTLQDAWPVATGSDGVTRYTTARPPLYTSSEVGLSSPAVVNDVVFVSTNKAALYALDAATGLCLWSAPGLPGGRFVLGPAIWGDYVVIGCGSTVYRYRLPVPWVVHWPVEVVAPWWEKIPPPWPPPDPIPSVPPWPGPDPLPDPPPFTR